MSLSKTSGKRAISKSSTAVGIGARVNVETGSGGVYSLAVNNPATKVTGFTEVISIVLTVNPELDRVISEEELNSKAESAKQMFTNYRNKK
jgi:hypothetical protein